MSLDVSNENVVSAVLRAVFFSLMIDLLGFTVILPLFPSLLDFYKENDKGTLYKYSEHALSSFRGLVGIPEEENVNSVLFGGMIGSLFSILQFINSPLFGAASDAYGRRPIIILSLIGSSVSYMVWAVSSSFNLFILARVIAGLSEANVSICTSVIADLKQPKAKSKGMALIGVAFSIGFVVGPLVGAIFSKLNSSAGGHEFFFGPAAFSLAITCIDIVYVLGQFPETLPPEKRASSIVSSFREVSHLLNPVSLFNFTAVKSIQGNMRKVLQLRLLGAVYFFYLFFFSGLEFTLTFLAHRRFNFTRMDQGKMFAVLGLTMALVQGGYVRRKMEGKEKKMAMMGIMMLIPSFVIIGMASSVAMMYAGLFFFSFAAACVVPCLSSLTASYGMESEKGRVMGILRSLGALARGTGPLCASACYWLIGAKSTYFIGAVCLLLPLYMLSKLSPVKITFEDEKEK